MDNKQMKRILSSVYKAILFFVICAIGWVGYFCINNLIQATNNILWLDISLLSFAFLLFISILVDISKTKKLKNLFGLSKYLFFLCFIFISAIIAGVFVLYYTEYILTVAYLLTVGVLLFATMLSILGFITSLKLIKVYKGTSVLLDDIGEVPNYDDELNLKKKLDELNRKKEMKKVVDQIESIKKELGE